MRAANTASVCFVSDARLETDGRVYWDPRQSFPEGHWAEPVKTFSRVIVGCRVRHVVESDPLGPVLPDGIEVIEFPNCVGLLQALAKLPGLMIAARRCMNAADICVLRGPGMLSMLVWGWIRLRRRSYAVEVLGDMEEVFAVNPSPFAGLFQRIVPPMVRAVCSRAAAVLYVSRAMESKYPASRDSESVVASDVRMPRSLFRKPRTLAAAPKELMIVHVGNMERIYKGHETMIRAVALCKKKGINVRLQLIGDGRLRESFEKLAADLDVKDVIDFEGSVPWGPALFQKLDAAHLFIFPSLTEAIGKALIEAMARGLPVIASRVGGIPELVDADMLIPPDDPKALADRIAAVAGEHKLLNSMALRCYENATRYMDERLSPMRQTFYAAVRYAAVSRNDHVPHG